MVKRTLMIRPISDLITVVAAVAVLIVVVVIRRRRAQTLIEADEYNGPEPTEAEVLAAEESIRFKTAESVRQAKLTLFKSLAMFLFLAIATMPFIAGMPLNRLFRPWGQLLLVGSTLAFASSAFAVLGFVSARSYKKALEGMLESAPGTRSNKTQPR
jgi:hypothetical protein